MTLWNEECKNITYKLWTPNIIEKEYKFKNKFGSECKKIKFKAHTSNCANIDETIVNKCPKPISLLNDNTKNKKREQLLMTYKKILMNSEEEFKKKYTGEELDKKIEKQKNRYINRIKKVENLVNNNWNNEDKKLISSIDPGERTFLTIYGLDHVVKILKRQS